MSNDNEQRTDAWFSQRCGRVTASRVADVIAKTKTGYGAGRANYMAQLVAERLTGQVQPMFSNAAMQWGCDTESTALEAYSAFRNHPVGPVGFVAHPEIEMAGASPDGLVGDFGLVEVKCPQTATHIDTLLGECVPGKYVTQMQWQLATTGRDWCDFASFDPRMPEHLSLFVRRVERDDDLIAELEREVRAFLSELDAKVTALQALRREAA